MVFLSDTVPLQQFQQPPTTSGLKAPLDWAVVISLLMTLILIGWRAMAASQRDDQKTNDLLIKNLLEQVKENNETLTEIKTALAYKQSENESVVFRLRDANTALTNLNQSMSGIVIQLSTTEREISALHRRLDLVGAPHSSDQKDDK